MAEAIKTETPAETAETTEFKPTGFALPPGHLVVPQDEWNRLRTVETNLAQIEREKAAEVELKEAERLRAIAEKEGAEAALAAQKNTLETKLSASEQRYQQLERQTLETHRDTILAQAFAGRVFSGETSEDQAEMAADLRELLEKKYESKRDQSGKIVVIDKATGLPAALSLRNLLDGKRYASFFAPKGKGGGTGGGGGDKPPKDTPADEAPKPGSYAEIVANIAAQKAQRKSVGL